MKGIYLGAYKAYHPGYNIDYQDINGKRDISGDMMDIDLSCYDFIIATPPCNFWSKANHNPNQYSLDTAHLLPDIINKLEKQDKPFIVENVRNYPKFVKYGILPRYKTFVYYIGRHTIFTNVMFNTFVPYDIEFPGTSHNKSFQGGKNVHNIIESWLKEVHYLFDK